VLLSVPLGALNADPLLLILAGGGILPHADRDRVAILSPLDYVTSHVSLPYWSEIYPRII